MSPVGAGTGCGGRLPCNDQRLQDLQALFPRSKRRTVPLLWSSTSQLGMARREGGMTMSVVKKTTLITRIKAAIKAFRGKPIGHLYYGLELKECSKCEYRKVCADKKEE